MGVRRSGDSDSGNMNSHNTPLSTLSPPATQNGSLTSMTPSNSAEAGPMMKPDTECHAHQPELGGALLGRE